MQSPWTDERVETAKRLHSEGVSMSDIAAALNCGFSRNAVIGKLHRMGIFSEVSPVVREERAEARRNRSKAKKPKSHATARAPRYINPSRAPELQGGCYPTDDAFDLNIPEAQRKQLLELTEDTCRWPVGDPGSPEFFFCGAHPKDGHPYCGTHCQRAFTGFGSNLNRYHWKPSAAVRT